jgi:putative alpha-1,2-mannosidase
MAKGLGKMKDYAYYLERSKGWKNLWDSTTNSKGYYGFVGSKSKDGGFVEFDYEKHPDTWSTPFYEANSWTYSLFIPHDIDGMIQKMGGKKQFAERLDFAFKNELIAYWNEPAFLTIRLLNYADRPDLATYWTHRILNEKYDITGYPENDDTGAMSSWYVFTALGFFPNAGQDIYYLNAPIFKKSVIKLENGKTITVKATNVSKENIYIKSCKINNQVWNEPIIHHSDIANGALIVFDVVDYPTQWGKN